MADPTMDPPAYSNSDNVALPPSGAAKGVLNVFLAGTGAPADCCTGFLQSGIKNGLHTLGLSYQFCKFSVSATAQWCNTNEPGQCGCQEGVHREVILGGGGKLSGGLVNVTEKNSIVSRLIASLRYLDTHFATEGWGQFLTSGGGVDWSKVVVSGHSQGAGHAAYIAKMLQGVRRAVLLSGAEDQNVSCSWQGQPGWRTPPEWDRVRAFAHGEEDELNFIEANWKAAGWAQEGWTDIGDGSQSPPTWANATALLTHIPPRQPGGRANHLSTALDAYTPVDGLGESLYSIAVWPYLLTEGL